MLTCAAQRRRSPLERGHEPGGIVHVAEKVVIPENEVPVSHALDVRNHLMHRTGAKSALINLFEIAVAATIRTPACGEHRPLGEVAMPNQIAPGNRKSVQGGRAVASVARPGAAAVKLVEKLRPGLFRFAHHQMVAVLCRFIRPQRGVWSAHDHPGAAGPEARRHPVTVGGVGRVDRDGHDVGRAFIRNALVVFVHQLDLIPRFVYESRQIGHGNLGEIVELSPPNPVDLGVLRGDQQDAFPDVRCLHAGRRRDMFNRGHNF